MRRIAVALILAAASAGAVYWFATHKERVVQNEVKQRLKDPWSAQFKSIAFVKAPDGSTVVCGLVNAKNAMGAYAGFVPFRGTWIDQTAFFLLTDMSSDKKQQEIILTECLNVGVKF